MLELQEFGCLLKKNGFDFITGVPCSQLKGLINFSINHFNYIRATNEGEAVAIAAGAQLGGRNTVVLLQNSGLPNALAPLTSLNYVFKIPVLGFVSLRGQPGAGDEPQHELLGKITRSLLEICNIHTYYLSPNIAEAEEQMHTANGHFVKNESVFFIVKKTTFGDHKISNNIEMPKESPSLKRHNSPPELPTRWHALETLSRLKDKYTIILATTGKCGRELFEIGDSPQNFYMVGSMGCVSSIGLGLALANPKARVIAIDGDGSLLMRLGSLTTNGFYRPTNMLHVLFDNESHDTTGGQDTVSGNVDFPSLAANSGYPNAVEVNTIKEFVNEVEIWMEHQRLTFLSLRIAKGSKKNLGRPTVSPEQVKNRLMRYLQEL